MELMVRFFLRCLNLALFFSRLQSNFQKNSLKAVGPSADQGYVECSCQKTCSVLNFYKREATHIFHDQRYAVLSRLSLRGAGDDTNDAVERNRPKKKRKRKVKETPFSILMSEEKKRRPWKQNKEKVVSVQRDIRTDAEEYVHGHLRPIARINKNEILKPNQGVISWEEWEQRQRESMRALKRKKSSAHGSSSPVSRANIMSEGKDLIIGNGGVNAEDGNETIASRMSTRSALSDVPSVARDGSERFPGAADIGESIFGHRDAVSSHATAAVGSSLEMGQEAAGKQEIDKKEKCGLKLLRLTHEMLESMTKRQLLKAALRHGIRTFQTAPPNQSCCVGQ